MQYRFDKYGNKISTLGFGCMRFTTNAGRIDINKAKSEIKAAFDGGVNYYDTAYIYPGSEAAVGRIFEELGIRDSIYIATKLPHYLIRKPEDFDRIFNEELERLRTDHIDYYLIHMLNDPGAWNRVCEMGIKDWIKGKKEEGKIRQVGFSYHGNSDMFCSLIDAYDWEFCQIQYNYMDEHSQAGITGLKYAAEKGLPIIIMEPLRGGRLANKLPYEAVELMNSYPVKRNPAAWGFRWLWNQPEITCVLSGMNSLEMVEDNIKTASEINPGDITEDEFAVYEKVVDIINKNTKVPCTGCRYCMPCPRGVNIPGIFSSYNNICSQGMFVGVKEYVMCNVIRNRYTGISNCIGCGKCEQHCPQNIEIRKKLREASKVFENLPLKLVYKVIPKIVKY
ncbi:MAG: aldo/keto reductase [Bacteroidaceae bacterium]|nr:aldo/keto reductase [Bacteroidaceae bacterium]MCF0228362.1 aldo/keto reductase [Parasporobacterium sp.]